MGSKSTASELKSRTAHQPPLRFLGLELSGAKNPKTAVSAIEYYPREKKIFLLDVYDRVVPHDKQTGDEALFELMEEVGVGVSGLGVNVPLALPPCFTCTPRQCKVATKCSSPATQWMHDFVRKNGKNAISEGIKVLPFTPYTQRPVEIWARYGLLPSLSPGLRFEIDETLGGNKAPLTARMKFLKRSFAPLTLVEAWPKLSIVMIAEQLGVSRRVLGTYRQLESGSDARHEILTAFSDRMGVFIYERDLKKLSTSLAAFDSFICAYTSLLHHQGLCLKAPAQFPKETGWVAVPKRPLITTSESSR